MVEGLKDAGKPLSIQEISKIIGDTDSNVLKLINKSSHKQIERVLSDKHGEIISLVYKAENKK